jgi:hypothetical protein
VKPLRNARRLLGKSAAGVVRLHRICRVLEHGSGEDRERAAGAIFGRLLEHDVVTTLLCREGLLAAVRAMVERLEREGVGK